MAKVISNPQVGFPYFLILQEIRSLPFHHDPAVLQDIGSFSKPETLQNILGDQ